MSVRRAASRAASPLAAYLAQDDEAKARGLLQILSPDGTLDEVSAAELEPARDARLARRLYEDMLRIRIADERLMALQRQGRISFYGEARGQEAAVVGTAAASQPQDWIVPALREAGVGLTRGLTLRSYVAQIFGNANDPTRGRQMPCHPCDRATNYVVMSSCVSTQVPHAVGIGMAMKIAGDGDRCVFGYMGDGGTSEADFHVSLNFAGVFKPPVVLVCQNNQWAISTPGSLQTASETIAIKALAYGVEPLRADGNDILAVYATAQHAAEKARAGGGPTFIEYLTYRVSAHTSSDDPSRYRDESVTLEWREKKDPIHRSRAWLLRAGWLTEAEDARLREGIESAVRDAIAAEEAAPPPALDTLIQDVYEYVPWHLKEQLEKHHG